MSVSKEDGIDFIGIGAQKTASSWLWKLLKEHDDIWLPPIKELHYFDRDTSYPSPSFLFSESLRTRLHGQEPHNILFRDKLISTMSQQLLSKDTQKIHWLNKFFFSEFSDEWYVSLFDEGKGKLRGEITPSYSIISQQDIHHIRTLFPELKIILVIRDPVERAWSQARFYMKHNKLALDSSAQEIKAFLDSPAQESRSNYSEILNNWESVYPKEQIFIGFYGDILANSSSFIVKICDFLGVGSKKILQSNALSKKVNTSPNLALPNEINEYLQSKYSEEREYLISRFGRL